MNKQFDYGGWHFDFDKEKTQLFYSAYHDLCSCASCRNFYANATSLPVELKSFLEQFGIDAAKPIEQWSLEADRAHATVNNAVYYAVTGTARSNHGRPVDIGSVEITVMAPSPDDVVHCPENSPNADIEEPYFMLQLLNLWLPWTVGDDIEDCYPEPKSFGQRIHALFKRAKK